MTQVIERNQSESIPDVGLENDLNGRTTVRIPKYQKDEIAYIASISNRTFSGQLRQIIDEWAKKIEEGDEDK